MTHSTHNTRRGFTLAEVLIATTLTASLFAGLWTILGIFSKLQMRSESFAGRAQITRGLIAQIQDDLDRIEIPAIRETNESSSQAGNTQPIPNPGNPGNPGNPSSSAATSGGNALARPNIAGLPSGAAASSTAKTAIADPIASVQTNLGEGGSQADPVGLRGSASWFIMEFPMAIDDLQRHQQTVPTQTQTTLGNDESPLRPPSRKRVLYHYVSPELALVEEQLRTGLTRWEIPTAISIDDLIIELNEGQFGTSKSRLWDQFGALQDGGSSIGDSLAIDARQRTGNPADELNVPREPVPEIERCLIRYYSQSGWRRSWNRSKALPSAIEVLAVWRDPKAPASDPDIENGLSDPNPQPQDNVSQTDDASAQNELTEARILTAWEQLGSDQFSANAQELPPGFARYLFTVPAALVPDRATLDGAVGHSADTTIPVDSTSDGSSP